ncbi:MAG: TolC family protein [Pseudomonadota bacterium]
MATKCPQNRIFAPETTQNHVCRSTPIIAGLLAATTALSPVLTFADEEVVLPASSMRGTYSPMRHSLIDESLKVGSVHRVGESTGFLARSFLPSYVLRHGYGHKDGLLTGRSAHIDDRHQDPVLRHSVHATDAPYDELRGHQASVSSSVSLALRGSFSAKARRERSRADRLRIYSALAGFLPKADGYLQIGRDQNFKGFNTSNDNQNDDTFGGSIQVSVPLFTSGVLLNAYRQSVQVSIASDYSYLAEEHRVALEAIAAHVNLRLNRRIVKALRSNVRAMERISSVARRLYEAGDASRTDIAIAQANVEGALAEVETAIRSRDEVRADFETLTTGHAPDSLMLPDAERFVPSSLEEALASAQKNNPALQASRHSADAKHFSALVERGRHGPQINLYGGVDREFHNSGDDDRESGWNVGVRLKVPLIDFTSAPNIYAARHDALESRYRALDQARSVERQIKRQWAAYNSAKRRYSISRRQVAAVAKSVAGTRREYEAGFRSITDLLNDQVKLARTKIALETTAHEQMLIGFELAFTSAHPSIHQLALNVRK